jgi:hypothetical protein
MALPIAAGPCVLALLLLAPPGGDPLDPNPDPGCGQPPMGSLGAPRFEIDPPATPPVFDANALLLRLEESGERLRELSAGLTLIRFDALLDEHETRIGEVVLSRDPGAPARVAVVFDEFIDGSGHGEKWRQHWVYADGWLSELDHRQRRYVRRQLVEPGERFDPLKVGEGPIPLPIAQSRAEVLARFSAIEAPPPSPPLLDRLERFVSIRLVPRPGTDLAEDTAWVDLFYDEETLAPLGIRVLKLNGNRDTVWLRQPRVNSGFEAPQEALLLMTPPDPAQWQYDVRPLRAAGS